MSDDRPQPLGEKRLITRRAKMVMSFRVDPLAFPGIVRAARLVGEKPAVFYERAIGERAARVLRDAPPTRPNI